MEDEQLANIYATQKSLTEWFKEIGHPDAEALQREDSEKSDRLRLLHEIAGLPYGERVRFDAVEVTKDNPAFAMYLDEHRSKICGLRLVPKEDNLPKIRTLGKSVADAFSWFQEQAVDQSRYWVDFFPIEAEDLWATIFIVNQYGIHGEIIAGSHHQLTQGVHDHTPLIVFDFDFKNWHLEPQNPGAKDHLRSLIEHLHITDAAVRSVLEKELSVTFAQDYIEGYWETTHSSEVTRFIDYSPRIGKMYADLHVMTPQKNLKASLHGHTGGPGKADGTARIVLPEAIASTDFSEGEILICPVTTPDYIPLMQKAAAIVAEGGGILSHAVIIAREMKKPCIVGVSGAITTLKNGQFVSVDADSGTLTLD